LAEPDRFYAGGVSAVIVAEIVFAGKVRNAYLFLENAHAHELASLPFGPGHGFDAACRLANAVMLC
jgi:hypothetical protein